MSAEAHEPAAPSPETDQAADNLYTRTVRAATQNLKLLTVYFTAVAASVGALLYLGNSHEVFVTWIGPWILPTGIAIAFVPIACTFTLQTLPAWLERRRARKLRAWSLSQHDVHTGYFRIGPYEDNVEDRERYTRADDEHKSVLDWINKTKLPILFLTGCSGTGKTSLLNAFVIPELRNASPPVRAITLRSFDLPLDRLVEQLLTPGTIWQQLPKKLDNETPLAILTKACRYLAERNERLLLVFDQFEELVILDDADSSRARDVREFLKEVQSSPIQGFTVLLSVRSDYAGLLSDFGLPPLQEGTNWRTVNPFSLAASREFLQKGFPKAGPNLVDAVLTEANSIDDTKGLIRPITLNMLGQVVQRAGKDLARSAAKGKLLENDLRQCLDSGEVKDHARRILKPMLSKAGTKWPRRIDDLSREISLDQHVVEGCLLHLNSLGLVRRINRERELAARMWEISHDFVARLLFGILVHKRRSLGRRILQGAAAVALVIWGVTFLVLLPEYLRSAPHRAMDRLERDYGFTFSANPDTHGYIALGHSEGDVPLEMAVLLSQLGPNLELVLRKSDSLTNVERLQRLRNLLRLDLSDCDALTKVEGLKETGLQVLDLSDCDALKNVEGLKGLTGLQVLHLSNCRALTNADGLQGLAGLQVLHLSNCRALTNVSLQGLTGLQKLDMTNCNTLTNVDGLQGLTGLQTLDLSFCDALTNLSLQGLTGLQTLNLSSCHTLTNVDGLQGLTGLQTLDLSVCRALTNVGGLQGLTGLQTLDLSSCGSLTNVDGLQGLTGLQTLDLSGCDWLKNTDELHELAGLQTLDLSSAALVNVNGLQGLNALQRLDLSYCRELLNVNGLQGLNALQRLDLSNCSALQDVNGLQGLNALQRLDLSDCSALQNVNGLQGLTGLQTLSLSGCHTLTNVDVLQELTGLEVLNLRDNDGFTNVSLQRLTGLQELRLGGNKWLQDVDSLQGLTNLQRLDLSDCDALTNVEGLKGLTGLQVLDLSRCDALTSVEGLRGLTGLLKLDLSDCDVLTNVDGLQGLTSLVIVYVKNTSADIVALIDQQLPNSQTGYTYMYMYEDDSHVWQSGRMLLGD